MKAFGLDTEKEYTPDELDAAIEHANARFEYHVRQMITATAVLCGGMILDSGVYHGLVALLGLS